MNANNKDIPDKINATGKPLKRNKNVTTKKIDSTDVKNGKIDENSVIDCIINKNGPAIREIIIKNYRQKERLDEIINTATWSLTRMLENSVK